MDYELKHYGVPGMKWGVRKAANQASVTTSAKRKTYKSMSDDELKKTNNRMKAEKEYRNLKGLKTKNERINDDLNNTYNLAKNTSDMYRSASNVANDISRLTNGPSKKTRQEMHTMSDAELRARINRQTMEQQYANLNPSRISKGASTVGTILSAVGSAVGVAASAVQILSYINKIKGKK